MKLFLYIDTHRAHATQFEPKTVHHAFAADQTRKRVDCASQCFKLTELYSINIDHKRLHSFTLADVPAAARPCRRRRRLAAALTKPSVTGAVPALHRRRHSNLSQSCYCRYCVASFTILSTITGHAIDNLNTMCTL